jgi:hypothetical protein
MDRIDTADLQPSPYKYSIEDATFSPSQTLTLLEFRIGEKEDLCSVNNITAMPWF